MKTLSSKAKNRLTGLINYLKTNKDHLVIDGDTHPTDLSRLEEPILQKYKSTSDYYQGRPIGHKDLLYGMATSGIDMSLIWQNPAAFNYTEDKSQNFEKLLQANYDISAFATDFPEKFIPAGWTDPKSLGLDNALKMCEISVMDLGFPIVKMNPAQNAFPIDSDFVFTTVEKIIGLGATPAFHFGGDSPYTPAEGLERIISTFPEHPFIGVHMGGGGSHYVEGDPTYLKARELGLKYPNLFYILSAKRDTHIESDLILYTEKGKPFMENLAWGSDAPYGLQSWNIGGIKNLFKILVNRNTNIQKENGRKPPLFTKDVIQNYLGTNLANLVIKSCETILLKNEELIERNQKTH